MSMLASNVNLSGGGSGDGYVPVAKKKNAAIDPDATGPRSTNADGGGQGAGYRPPRADVQEVFLFTLTEPFKGALSKLMGLLEQVNNIPNDVRIAIVSGPLGYMPNLRAVRPTPFSPTPTLLRPTVR
jgi:hypothetical protein